MTEPLASNDPGTQKRRSTRIVQAVPLTVTGVDALGQPFKERTTTVMVNCHGCKYQSKHYVPKNSIITLEIPRQEQGLPPRTVQGRVIWVQRPRTVRELFQIGLEFEIAGNVWGIAFPPEDWTAYPDEGTPEFHVSLDSPAAPEPRASAPAPQRPHPGPPPEKVDAPVAGETSTTVSAPPSAPAALAADAKIHVMPSPAQDSQLVIAKQMAKLVAEAKQNLDKSLRQGAETAINEEMTVVRQQLDAQLHDAVEKAIKVSMDRVSESAVKKVVQQAAERTASIVDEARKASETNTAQLDAKIRQAVHEAVSGAAEQAAQQAAQQTAASNLKQAVEEAVERAISGREASTPSLEMLSSPEAAQKHLDEWKKNLEETAQTVRNQTVAQTSVEAAAASQRWREEFDAALSGATEKLGEKLNEASQRVVIQAEEEIAARSSKLRSSLSEVVTEAEASIRSLGAGLKQERARAEETKAQLQDAASLTLADTRRQLDELLSSQSAEIGRKADQVIAERAEQIEPTLQAAAQKVAERLSGQLDEKLAPKLEQVQNAVSQLANAEQQAAQLQNALREQVQQASDHAAQLQNALREQVRQASEQTAKIQSNVRERVQEASQEAIEESLARLKQETSKIPAEVEQKSREVVSRIEEELEQKRVETEQTTYESLLKASEWYQKKAQTTMQTTLERAVEQSTTALRDRAAEISSLLASELDHYRRTYVEHSQAQIEDAAKEVVDRERGKLSETADIASADFADRVHKVTGDSLRRFEQVSRDALEKAHSDMEYNREGSLVKFQEKLDERLQEGIEQAREQLQSQLLPLMQAWDSQRETQQREWMEQLAKSSNESIEQYKTRLENASNSWLLASATTLGQHSQTVLETIAKAAEKRLRETCSDVLAGMGDTLKERLLGMSTEFGKEEDENGPPKKKK
ncbi:MAG TPA: hypothetical protein VEX69_09760 [Candidatus Limnocylindria bacterium]|nr:hypothetical protein [Candidatus Limnocylindria bacterium]